MVTGRVRLVTFVTRYPRAATFAYEPVVFQLDECPFFRWTMTRMSNGLR